MALIANKLNVNDEVRIIAPSLSMHIISEENIGLAVERLGSLGLKVSFGKNVNEVDKMSSSSITSRLKDLHDAFSDKNVKAILTVIGGFNTNQLLNDIDYDLIQRNPKIFCGYSDITVLLNAIYSKTGLVTYSGPHFSTFAMQRGFEYTLDHFKKIFFEKESINCVASEQWSDDAWFLNQADRNFYENKGYWIINEGSAVGTIIGGSLSTFQLLHGTAYMPSLENTLLFIEADSITEGKYDAVEFDRDLQSLIHQPNFDKVQGLVIGRFETKFNMDLETLEFIIKSKKKLNSMPIIANVDFGHTNPLFTFPIGGECKIDARKNNTQIVFSEK